MPSRFPASPRHVPEKEAPRWLAPVLANASRSHLRRARCRSYSVLSNGTTCVDPGQDAYERAHTARVVRNLSRRAHQLGFQLVKIDLTHALATAG